MQPFSRINSLYFLKAEERDTTEQKCDSLRIKYYFCERLNQYFIEERCTTDYRKQKRY